MFLLYVLFCLHFTCLNQDLYKATCWSWLVGFFSFFSSTGFASTSLSPIFSLKFIYGRSSNTYSIEFPIWILLTASPRNLLMCSSVFYIFSRSLIRIRSFGLGQSYFKLGVTCRILVDALDYQVGEVPFCSQFAKSFIRTGCRILSNASCIF